MSDVKEDSILAQAIVSGKNSNLGNEFFHSSSIVYKFTNENISDPIYSSAIENRKKILSVIGSGDHILNSILLGSRDITGYDISVFPKYFFALKVAAIKSLSYEEFLSFFAGGINQEFCDDFYDKLISNLNDDDREFWDSLFNYFDSYEIYNSTLFSSEPFSKSSAIFHNSYLKEENYYKMKTLLDNINIRFYDGNIFEMKDYYSDKYDLVNLSNIWYYMKGYNRLDNYRKFLEKLPLSDGGLALSYLYFCSFDDAVDIERKLSCDTIFSSCNFLSSPSNSAIVLSKKR